MKKLKASLVRMFLGKWKKYEYEGRDSYVEGAFGRTCSEFFDLVRRNTYEFDDCVDGIVVRHK